MINIRCSLMTTVLLLRLPAPLPSIEDKKKPPRRVAFSCLEQDTGVEPAFTAWEAVVLPIYESCMCWYYSRAREKKQPLFVEAGIRQPMPPVGNHPGKNRKIPEKVLDNRHIFR